MEFVFISGVAISLFVMDRANKKYQEGPVIQEIKKRVSLIDQNFSFIKMYENRQTYAHNKKDIYICLKDNKGKYYDMNTLIYVTLHEIAHVITRGEKSDHDQKFLDNFNMLLKKAKRVGIWDPKIKMPEMYCNVKH